MLLTSLFYLIVPVLLIGLIAFKRQPDFLSWVLAVISYGLVISFLWATARWEIVSIYLRTIFPVLYLISCWLGYKRIIKEKLPLNKIRYRFGIAMTILLLIFMSVFNWLAFRGYKTPKGAINLTSPLRQGRYIIINGGSRPMINAHSHTVPQNYALDIVGLNKLGMRASSFSGGANLNNYAIYGDTVYSPCNGTIIVAVDEYDDLTPPETDTKHPAGNHVLIQSDDVEILLAHFKKGSVKVKKGEVVSNKTILGQVGNTGNTSEPHLHIHAERGGEPGTILNGVAVPFTINKRFLLRGNIIKSENY